MTILFRLMQRLTKAIPADQPSTCLEKSLALTPQFSHHRAVMLALLSQFLLSTASKIVEDLIDDGHVLRGWLGVQIQPVTLEIAKSIGLDNAKGAIVASAQAESPANDAGNQAR